MDLLLTICFLFILNIWNGLFDVFANIYNSVNNIFQSKTTTKHFIGSLCNFIQIDKMSIACSNYCFHSFGFFITSLHQPQSKIQSAEVLKLKVSSGHSMHTPMQRIDFDRRFGNQTQFNRSKNVFVFNKTGSHHPGASMKLFDRSNFVWSAKNSFALILSLQSKTQMTSTYQRINSTKYWPWTLLLTN